MKRSTERVLTTHAGSLPQSADLQMLIAKNNRQPYDRERLSAFVERRRWP
jgi:hypothetical protein